MNKEEIFPLVNSDGEVVGKATRSECHSGSMLMHPVVHLHVMKKGDGCICSSAPCQRIYSPASGTLR